MKKTVLLLVSFIVLAAVCEVLILREVPLDPRRLAAFLACFVLILTAFVAFTLPAFVKYLRAIALISPWHALAMPFALLVPYLILALGTGTFSILALAKLAAYVALPTLLVLPDRPHRATSVGWRDFAAMLALALPVGAGWLGGIWIWPEEVYFFRPLFCVCAGAYAFMVVRNLDGVGFRLTFRSADLFDGLANFAAFALPGILLGYALGFIAFRPVAVSFWDFAFRLFGTYVTIAIPEELLFRGILQNFLVRSINSERRGLYGLLIAAVIFGASHLHHAPAPNWRYALMATLAGIFYGNAYRTRHRLCAPALTHALVDAVWHFWF